MRTSGGGGGGGDVVQHTMKRKALRRMKPASLFDFQMTKGLTTGPCTARAAFCDDQAYYLNRPVALAMIVLVSREV
ncbi:hypothetical protein T03_11174 [Trichinella britovi]|uniref:Uncharacterized protein n=1 Tax=Trichinella britovi TaxID=45882 RepID=A0A0V1CWV3_TRIBR|nr:hypothetical protein T03_11174 [Trichinella britovi]